MTSSLLAEHPQGKGGVEVSTLEALKGLELIAGRANSVYADFVLAGPLNMWLKGLPSRLEPRYILVTSEKSAPSLERALCVNASRLKWSQQWSRVTGKLVRCSIYNNYIVEALVNPGLCGEKYEAMELARDSGLVQVGNYMIRLAPLYFEAALGEALLGKQSCYKE
jgi:hypothetical protein